MALIVVIWVMTFFSIILSAFAFSMRTEVAAARSFKEEAEAAALAEAGVARAMVELVNARRSAESSPPSVPWYSSGEIPLGRGVYQILVTEEESRIPLNQAPAEVLDRLLQGIGVADPSLRDTLVDSILDWRDPDDLHHLHGAETDYYQSLSHPFHPRNGDFQYLEELLLVKGMTREIFYGNVADKARLADLLAKSPEERDFLPGEFLGIARFLTVNGSSRVNIHTAGLDVLVALGVPAPEVKAILESRRGGLFQGQFPASVQGIQLTTRSTTYRVESTGHLPELSWPYRITAVLRVEPAPKGARIRVVSWKEGSET